MGLFKYLAIWAESNESAIGRFKAQILYYESIIDKWEERKISLYLVDKYRHHKYILHGEYMGKINSMLEASTLKYRELSKYNELRAIEANFNKYQKDALWEDRKYFKKLAILGKQITKSIE